ncbi:hypothetical protein RB979_001424 [Vibrio alginolyticus]|uniref:hypothetical protein n=1 Tax=Vibrio alginolyticus TaxID=663 RepID=UPI00280865F2|nr:hypothetical protein [Vibrio alginolyticus]
MSHKISPALKNLPDIDSWISIDVAIRGAQYHFIHIKRLLDMFDTGATKISVSQMNWLIRGFFWELVGAFDLILQWVNKRFQLEVESNKTRKWETIDVGRVQWSRVKRSRAKIAPDLWNNVIQYLIQVWESEWYFEVRTYRNYAHKSLFEMTEFTRTDGKGNSQWFISLAREGQGYDDLRILLPSYIAEFERLAANLKDLTGK